MSLEGFPRSRPYSEDSHASDLLRKCSKGKPASRAGEAGRERREAQQGTSQAQLQPGPQGALEYKPDCRQWAGLSQSPGRDWWRGTLGDIKSQAFLLCRDSAPVGWGNLSREELQALAVGRQSTGRRSEGMCTRARTHGPMEMCRTDVPCYRGTY